MRRAGSSPLLEWRTSIIDSLTSRRSFVPAYKQGPVIPNDLVLSNDLREIRNLEKS